MNRIGEPTGRVGHASCIDKNGRLRQLDGGLIHRYCLPGFEKVLNVKVNGITEVRECFLMLWPQVWQPLSAGQEACQAPRQSSNLSGSMTSMKT
jgi:hypothetical protein